MISGKTSMSSWIVCQHYSGTKSMDEKFEKSMKCLPWVGVAVPLTNNDTQIITYEDVKPEGNIFCFLPLPLQDTSQTGMILLRPGEAINLLINNYNVNKYVNRK